MMSNLEPGYLPIVVRWMDQTKWIFATTEKFPKKARLSLTNRILNLALEILTELVEAQYEGSSGGNEKLQKLKTLNVKLEQLRLLFRISFEMGLLPHASLKQSARAFNEVGKMLGGWIRQQKAAGPKGSST